MTASLATRVLVAPIRFYQRFISPALPPSCRYSPSCSSYAVEALQVHGPLRGSWFAVRRIGRCHPWHAGGYDPVPPARERSSRFTSSTSAKSVADASVAGQDKAATSAVTTPDARPATAEAPTPRSNAA